MKSFLSKKNTTSFLLLYNICFFFLSVLILINRPKLDDISIEDYRDYSFWIFSSGYVTLFLIYTFLIRIVLRIKKIKVCRSTRLFTMMSLLSSVLSILTLSFIPIYSKDPVLYLIALLAPIF